MDVSVYTAKSQPFGDGKRTHFRKRGSLLEAIQQIRPDLYFRVLGSSPSGPARFSLHPLAPCCGAPLTKGNLCAFCNVRLSDDRYNSYPRFTSTGRSVDKFLSYVEVVYGSLLEETDLDALKCELALTELLADLKDLFHNQWGKP